MGTITKLIAAQPESSVDPSWLAGGPATVPDTITSAVARQGLDLSMNLKPIHRITGCMEGRHQGIAFGGISFDCFLALHITGNHRLLGHAAEITDLLSDHFTRQV